MPTTILFNTGHNAGHTHASGLALKKTFTTIKSFFQFYSVRDFDEKTRQEKQKKTSFEMMERFFDFKNIFISFVRV